MPEWYYLYRWGASPCHLSGQPDMQGLYDSLGAAPAAAGRFTLRPHWREDYAARVATPQPDGAPSPNGRRRAATVNGRQTRPRRAGCDTTFKRGAAYLAGVGRVEDWGCGTAYFKRFVPAGCYWGIDHDPSRGLRPRRRPGQLYLDNRRPLPAARARARPALAKRLA